MEDHGRRPPDAGLRITADRTMPKASPNVQHAGQEALEDGSIDASSAYLNNGPHMPGVPDEAGAQALGGLPADHQ